MPCAPPPWCLQVHHRVQALVPKAPSPWRSAASSVGGWGAAGQLVGPRLAGCSSFGMSGVNAHGLFSGGVGQGGLGCLRRVGVGRGGTACLGLRVGTGPGSGNLLGGRVGGDGQGRGSLELVPCA